MLDIPLASGLFIWSCGSQEHCMPHFERFLLSVDWKEYFSNASQNISQTLLDESTILLDCRGLRFVKTLFRFEDTRVKGKCIWVKWSTVCSTEEKGSFDIRILMILNKVSLGKWLWWFVMDKNRSWMSDKKKKQIDHGGRSYCTNCSLQITHGHYNMARM